MYDMLADSRHGAILFLFSFDASPPVIAPQIKTILLLEFSRRSFMRQRFSDHRLKKIARAISQISWIGRARGTRRGLSSYKYINRFFKYIKYLVSYLGRRRPCDPYFIPYVYVCMYTCFVCIKQGEKRKEVYKSGDDDQNAL